MEEMITALQHSQSSWNNTREATPRRQRAWFCTVLQIFKKCKPTFETRPLLLPFEHQHEQQHNLTLGFCQQEGQREREGNEVKSKPFKIQICTALAEIFSFILSSLAQSVSLIISGFISEGLRQYIVEKHTQEEIFIPSQMCSLLL